MWGLMAGLRGFSSHEGGILSGGWLWKWKSPDDQGHSSSISDAVVKTLYTILFIYFTHVKIFKILNNVQYRTNIVNRFVERYFFYASKSMQIV